MGEQAGAAISVRDQQPVTVLAPVIALEKDSLETVSAWQRTAGSAEVCCFLAVDQFGTQHLMLLRNNAGLPDAFEISSSEIEIARAAADQRQWQIVAFVHTHPDDPADMSYRDARCFHRDTLPWIIIGTPTSKACQRTYFSH